jgi:AraC-like DNA-binding protein
VPACRERPLPCQGDGWRITMEYLTRWRMLIAGDKLVNSGDPVSVIAPSLGYESESAFSTAFKRVMGCSPRQYSRDRNPAPLPVSAPASGPFATQGTPSRPLGLDLGGAAQIKQAYR